MSLFTLVSNGTPVSSGRFDEIAKMAAEERQSGHRVKIHRTTPAERTSLSRSRWAVRVYAAGQSDVLQCQDHDDAVTTLRKVRSEGVRASIVRV